MKKIIPIAIIAALLSVTAFFGYRLVSAHNEYNALHTEFEILLAERQEEEKENEKLHNTIAQLRVDQTLLEDKIDELTEKLEKYEPDPFKTAVQNLDPKVFLTDPENYAPTDDEIRITAKQAAAIAQKGFEESARRISGEGADDIDSQVIEVRHANPNNYFTRYGMQSDKVYTDISRQCYAVTRTNDMRCGITIYVDASSGLIIGGYAFGD